MARIYSWQLTDTKYAYITGIEDNEPFVGNRLNADDYETITTKVDSMTSVEYSANFQKLCILCERYGIDPTKGGEYGAYAFYNTNSLGNEFMVVLAGKNGKDGAKGEKGDKGDPGEPGAKADTPIPYISVTAYCSTGSNPTRPSTPTNISVTWNPNTNTYDFNDNDGKWFVSDSDANDNDGDGSDKSIIWQSSAIYNDKGIVNAWSRPIRITGENGEPGADGNNLEFIYRLWASPLPPNKPISVNENKYVPISEGWTGSPSGIDEDNPYEYMCQRDRDENGDWREWEEPIIWSRWGQDGKDGDGVEYCYYTTNGTPPKFRCPDEIYSQAYQQSEYRPIAQLPTGPGDAYVDVTEEGREYWFDNPQEVNNTNNSKQWVIVRKKKKEDGNTTAQWGEFTEPVLWSSYGDKGDRGVEGLNVYERKVYQASTGSSAPVYDRDNFDPGSMWSPAVPEKGTGEVIWCMEAYIKLNLETKKQELCWYDGSTEMIDGDVPHWCVPYIIEGRDGTDGTHYQEEIYRSYPLNETAALPLENIKNEDFFCPDGWNPYPIDMKPETPVCYMCYRERELKEHWGEWGDWQGPFLYTQLGTEGPAGLNGTDGKDGKGIEYIYCLTFTDEKPEHYSSSDDIAQGIVGKDDYCPLISGTDNRWTDEPQGVDEGNPFEWVKSRVKTYDFKNERMVWSDFSDAAIYAKWGFNGKDGKDIEYAYCLTKTYEKPGVVEYDNTSETAQSSEFFPEISFSGDTINVSGTTVTNEDGTTVMYWMDNAVDVSLEWPYQWEIIRKRIATPNNTNPNLFDYTWEQYTDDKVTLHSKWGRDGDQGRQGVAGVAGIHYEMRFILAKQDEEDNIILSMPKVNDSGTNFDGYIDIILDSDEWVEYWENTNYPNSEVKISAYRDLSKTYFPLYTDLRSVTQEYPYMFFIQSRIVEERTEIKEDNPNNGMKEVVGYDIIEILEKGTWERPARLTGKQGIQGPEGKNGPILYSAGVYGMGTKYYTDGTKKPYVLDPADKEYYYLEKGNCYDTEKKQDYWYMDEDGESDSMSKNPSSSVANGQDYWVKMERFDVILANVGIFNSALVGSGVFYGDWFYSQSGTINGEPSREYEKFLDVETSYDDNGNIEITYKEGDFKPNIALNLKDGSGWFAGGNISWGADGILNCNVNGTLNGNGKGSLADGAITWDDTTVTFNKNVVMGTNFTDNLTVKKLKTQSDDKNCITIQDNYMKVSTTDGVENLYISNNAINDEAFYEIFDITGEYANGRNTYAITMNYNSTKGEYYNSKLIITNLINRTFNLRKYATLKFTFSIGASTTGVQNWNRLQPTNQLKANTEWLTGGIILYGYCYNETTKTWVKEDDWTFTNVQVSHDEWSGEPSDTTIVYNYYFVVSYNGGSFRIPKTGKWKFEIRFVDYSVISASSKKIGSLFVQCKMEGENAEMKPFTHIGSNGFISYNGTDGIALTTNGASIISKVNHKTGTFYGWKTTKEGIYCCLDGTEWKKINNTKLQALLTT